MDIFDIASSIWSQSDYSGEFGLSERYQHAAMMSNNVIYYFGGVRAEGDVDTVDSYDPFDVEANWRTMRAANSMPLVLNKPGGTEYQNNYYLFGNEGGLGIGINNLLIYNLSTDIWNTVAEGGNYFTGGVNRFGQSVTLVGKKAYIWGGNDAGSGNETNALDIFDFGVCEKPNLLRNPSFEEKNTSNNQPRYWGQIANYVRSNEVAAQDGSYSMRHNSGSNATYIILQTVPSIDPAKVYSLSGFTKIPTTTVSDPDGYSMKIQVTWLRQNNSAISTKTVKTYTGTVANWQEFSNLNLIPPAGTVKAQIRMNVTSLKRKAFVDSLYFREN